MAGAMILVIDNYDSFTWNLVHYVMELGAEVRVERNDALTVADAMASGARGILLSPGPCTPNEAGITLDLVGACAAARLPLFGVCLGHQAIGEVFGGRIARARQPLHGQAAPIRHRGQRLFAGLPDPLIVGQYHSLVVEPSPALASNLRVDARSVEGEVMALSHRAHPTFGVQFHPESVLTPSGLDLLRNFLVLARAHAEACDALA